MARRGSGRVIDFKSWLTRLRSETSISVVGTSMAAGVLSFTGPGTILRCRGFVQAHFDSTAQISDTMTLTFGLGLVSTDAAVVGSSAMPDPGGNSDYPWLWWGSMRLRSELAAGPSAWGISAQRLEIDTKAMRRIKPEQTLVLVVEAASASGAPETVIEFGQTRVLIGV